MPLFTPLAPITLRDPRQLRYPLLVSPKIDGMRCCIHPELGPISRNRIPIPNPHVRKAVALPELHGLDGELVAGDPVGPDVLARTLAAIVAGRRPINWHLFVFDDFTLPDEPFQERLRQVQRLVDVLARRRVMAGDRPAAEAIHVLPHALVHDTRELVRLYDAFLAQGYEGAVLRAPDGRYRFGRATRLEAVKIKPPAASARRFEDVWRTRQSPIAGGTKRARATSV